MPFVTKDGVDYYYSVDFKRIFEVYLDSEGFFRYKRPKDLWKANDLLFDLEHPKGLCDLEVDE